MARAVSQRRYRVDMRLRLLVIIKGSHEHEVEYLIFLVKYGWNGTIPVRGQGLKISAKPRLESFYRMVAPTRPRYLPCGELDPFLKLNDVVICWVSASLVLLQSCKPSCIWIPVSWSTELGVFPGHSRDSNPFCRVNLAQTARGTARILLTLLPFMIDCLFYPCRLPLT